LKILPQNSGLFIESVL